jgi:DNA modification methylase
MVAARILALAASPERLAPPGAYAPDWMSQPSPVRPRASGAGTPPERPNRAFVTKLGRAYCGDSATLMKSVLKPKSVDLVMTSPPFGLVRKKDYGNEDADGYLEWFRVFAEGFLRILKPTGSLVIDIGGSWNKGLPTRSLYHFELLLMLCREYGFHLAQEFYWWNPAKLPTPAEWVTVRRIRVKDAVNCVWWLSPTPFPKASNRRVLQRYSDRMEELLEYGYDPAIRPSGHRISEKFQQDNGGAIPPNLIALANTESNGSYQRYCREHGLPEHPARFPAGIPALFTAMLTDPGDVVFDPFAGSCMTGEVAESMLRRWICCELEPEYVNGAVGRFLEPRDKDLVGEVNLTPRRSDPYQIHAPQILSTNGHKLDPAGGVARLPRQEKKNGSTTGR